MRLPLAAPLDSRDSDETIDARLFNMVVENYQGKPYVVNRAALSKLADQAGAAGGVMAFNGELLSLFGTTIYEALYQSSSWTDITAGSGLANSSAIMAYAGGKFFATSLVARSTYYSSNNGSSWTFVSLGASGQMIPNDAAASDDTTVIVGRDSLSGTNPIAYSTNDGVSWTSVTSPPEPTAAYKGVVYGNKLFVAVASSGTSRVAVSSDGVTWSGHSAAEANTWNGIAYGKGIYVAVAEDGTNRVMTSVNGTAWTARSAAEANPWKAIAYGNGLFVAVASSGTNRVMTSPDGVTWTTRSAAEANAWQDITFGDGVFVAVSSDGTNRAMVSTDGITWTAAAIGTATWSKVAYGNGVVIALSSAGAQIINRATSGFTLSAVDTVAAGTYDFAQTST